MNLPSVEVIGDFFRNAVAVLVVALTVMGVILFSQVHHQESQIQAAAIGAKSTANAILKTHCAFFYDLGTAPVTNTVNGKVVPATKLGVKIVIDSRQAYEGEHVLATGSCTKPLPPPSFDLIRLANQYGLTLGN